MQTAQSNQNVMELERCVGRQGGGSGVTRTMIQACCFIAALMAVMVGSPFSSQAASVGSQAESGTLGANFIVGNSGGVTYITNTNNNTAANPGIAGRVATYSVTFPAAGTYDLYARVWVGSGSANDDSFFYANGFGTKTVNSDADWILVNSINVGGFTNSGDVVSGSGTAGITVWKWINLSDFTGSAGETPISFTVTSGNLTQTFQIGSREDGLLIDALVFGTSNTVFTVANLDAAMIPLPASPTSLMASAGNGVVNLTWVQSTSPNITSNKVYRSTSGSGGPYSLLATVSARTSFADTAVVNGTQYFYTVTAINAGGESGFSSFSGATPNGPPAPPTGLTPTAGNGQVSLTWNASTGATSYNVKRATTSGGPYTTFTNVTATSVVNAGLANGTTYFFVVSALNASGESANSSQVSATPSGPPAAPTGLTPTPGNGQVSLTWNASTGATSYNVKRGTTSGGPYTTFTNATATSVVNSGLVNGTTYFFVVSALNAGGESANSSQVSATPVASSTPPLVYTVENTGSGFPAPPLPTLANLPTILPLTDPFMWSATDPSNWTAPTGRSTAFADWSHRRAEIKAEIENYEIGFKPPVNSAMIFASVSGTGTSRTLTVRVTNVVSGVNRTLTLTCAMTLPASSGTFPAIIGMNSPNGSVNSSILSGIARITFSHDQVTTYGNPQNSNPYYALYAAPFSPALDINNTGQYSAWAWGVSRIIDGLYKLNGNLGGGAQLNLQRIGVTGCSYAGKMALFCGALDERVALTIAQESGGGGAPNWRYSWQNEPNGTVEGLGQTDHNWFSEGMFAFAGDNTSKLPEDHHELMAMIAPRALFATDNPDFVWLSNPSCFVSCKAVERVYDAFGISDRFGYNIIGGHGHCATTASIDSEMSAFVDKFLRGNTSANTIIRDVPSSYSSIDTARWTAWWGTTSPVFPGGGATFTRTFEPECATVGSNWRIMTDANASNGKYVTVAAGLNSTTSPPTAAADFVTINFSVTNSGTFFVSGRVNCPDANGDSFYVRVDGGAWTTLNGLPVGGWGWASFGSFSLSTGSHTLTIAYREDGAQLDKISVSNGSLLPTGMGAVAAILCP